MIKLVNSIPDVVPEITDHEMMNLFLTQVKLAVEELSQKAQSRQMEIRSTAPGVNDIEEGEFVSYVNGANYYIYTKQNGVIKYATLT